MGKPIIDGTTSFDGGQNAGSFPDRIAPNQVAASVNTTFLEGVIQPRPGITEIELTVESDGPFIREDGNKVSYAKILKEGKFQGAGPYVTDSFEAIIATVSGVIYQIDPVKQSARVLIPEKQQGSSTELGISLEAKTQRINQYVPRHSWSQAGKYFVIHDFPDYPIILDGAKARRADPDKFEVPISTISTFNGARLFVGDLTSNFTAGDPIGNKFVDAPITFEEVLAPAAPFPNQVFSVRNTSTNNPITAMGSLQQTDDRTGIGPFFAATKNAVYAYATDNPRTQWEQIRFGRFLLDKTGVVGARAFVNVFGDIFAMSGDGRIHTFSVAANDQRQWAHTPMDEEIKNWKRFIDPELAQYTVAGYFNNRVFFTVNPYRCNARDLSGKEIIDYAFGGMVVLELDNMSGLLRTSAPAWAGLWTGARPMEIIPLGDDVYIFSKDSNNVNVLYKMELDDIQFDTWQRKKKQIRSRIYSRAYSFPQEGGEFPLKEEVAVMPGIKLVSGDFKLTIEKSSDFNPGWEPWRTFKHVAKTELDDFPFTSEMPILAKHNFREINFGSPNDNNACNEVTREQFRYFGKMQLRLTIEGEAWVLESLRLKAELQEDEMLITEKICKKGDPILLKEQFEISDFDIYTTAFNEYEELICQTTNSKEN